MKCAAVCDSSDKDNNISSLSRIYTINVFFFLKVIRLFRSVNSDIRYGMFKS